MIKTLTNLLKQDKEKFVVPKGVQYCIPITAIYDDGDVYKRQEKAWFKFRLVADRLCEKYGLYYNPNPNRSKQSSYYLSLIHI